MRAQDCHRLVWRRPYPLWIADYRRQSREFGEAWRALRYLVENAGPSKTLKEIYETQDIRGDE